MAESSQRSARSAVRQIDKRGVVMDIRIDCVKCGSKQLRLEYRIINRNTQSKYWDFVCCDCGYPSQLKEYFENPSYLYEYYASYNQIRNISDSFEQFTSKVLNYILSQVKETTLKDENGNQLNCWKGYVDSKVIHQFLRW